MSTCGTWGIKSSQYYYTNCVVTMQVSILLLSSNVKDFLTMIRDEREDIYRLIVGSKLRFPKARSAGYTATSAATTKQCT